MKNGFIFLQVCLFFVVSVDACGTEQSVLLATDSKAFYDVIIGEKKPESIVESTNLLLFNRLSLNAELRLLPTKRLQKLLDNPSQPACTFFKLETEDRLAKYIFSSATDIFLMHKIYLSKKVPPISERYLDTSGRVKDLSGFVNSSDEVELLYIEEFSYGDVIDKEIEKITPNKRFAITGVDIYQQFMKMMMLERYEIMIQYPAVIVDYADIQKMMRSYSISGVKPFVSGHIMCNDTPHSQRFIDRANKALDDLYITEEFLHAILDFTPENDRDVVNQLIKKYLAKTNDYQDKH